MLMATTMPHKPQSVPSQNGPFSATLSHCNKIASFISESATHGSASQSSHILVSGQGGLVVLIKLFPAIRHGALTNHALAVDPIFFRGKSAKAHLPAGD